MSTRYIRETVIKDVIDLLVAIKDGDEDFLRKMRPKKDKYSSSIAKGSKDLIMTFPIICSNTIDIKTATMVSKAIERKCVTMLQLLFSANCITDEKSAADFIKNFHNNIDMGNISVDDFLNYSNKLSKEFNMGSIYKEENDLIQNIKDEMKTLEFEVSLPVDSVNESSLQDFKISNKYDDIHVIREARPIQNNSRNSQNLKNYIDYQKMQVDSFTKQLLDNDVKKCNEMVPSLLIINVSYEKDKNTVVDCHYIVGVKARLIPVDSFEIIDKIFVKYNDSNTLLNIIRATTKETSFVKDFLLGVDKAKIDALSNSRRGSVSRIWKTLERRAIKSNINKALRRNNDATAITSLVITQDEADFLYKNYNIKIENIGTARNILQKYNLLSIVIVDESIEVVKFLFDGDDSFETLSFNNLERESGDGMYKKVINLMNKMK